MSKLLNKINISTLVVSITLFLLVLLGIANTLISYKHAKDDMFVAVQNAQAQNLKISWALFSQKGSFAIKDGKIYAGDYLVNGNFDIVDKIKDITGVTATVFQNEVRVSTNVLKDDGTRAVGTKLQGPAFDAIFKENKAYRGEAPILGKVYFTAYDPIKDASGSTIGVLYVGIQKAPFEAKMWERVGEDAILSLIFVIVGGIITWIMMKKALRPIAQFEAVAEVIISKGDFSKRSGIDSQNEIGRIARSFDNLLEEIQKVLLDISEVMAKVAEGDLRQRITAEARGDLGEIKQHINNSLDRLLRTLSGIASDIHQVANSATQASTAVDQLADGAQTQANSLKELAAAVHQSSQAVAEVAKSGNNASRNVMEAAKLSNEGRERMNRLLALMGQIEQNTRKIAGINEAVAQIAAQTNMLSLNAAIEAARAGDAGKGFAVVAEEVGKLAANAGRSAGEIEALIQTAVAGVAQGVMNANDTDKNIANIANSVNGISELIEAVASAMEEQQSTISEMARTIGEVDAISSQSAAAAAELTAIMGELAGIAEQSNEKIRQFRL